MFAFVFFGEKLKSKGFSSLFSPRKRVFGGGISSVVEFQNSDVRNHAKITKAP
jgi:hypothetical protein